MSFYFDNAATTFPKPECVYSFMDSFYRSQGGNAGRGQYKISSSASKVIFETRSLIQKILCCENKDVIFTPGATIALNMIISGVISSSQAELNVYITPFEHNSVTRVLHHYEKKGSVKVYELSVSDSFEYDFDEIKSQFEKISPDFVIASHASNVTGLICPIERLFTLAKEYGAITLTDMAQTAGLVPLNTGNSVIDFAVFAGHKTLYGPFGIGGFVKSNSVRLEPVLFGGTGIDSANQDMPDDIPARYEMGSQNICAIAGLYSALKWFIENQDSIRKTEQENHKRLLAVLKKYSFIKIAGPEDRKNCIGVVSTVFDDYSADSIGNILDEKDIAVRTGLQCSPCAHKFLKTFPAGTVRFSIGYFTGEEDFCALENALEYIKVNR